MGDGADYCAEQVARLDHDRYLTAILAPPDRRADLMALYAFNIEIAKTREVVTEPLIGQMRLQWWRDALDALYAGRSVAHEVTRPLARAIAAHGLSRGRFDSLIDAREADLDDSPPLTIEALEGYARATNAPLIELALEILGPPPVSNDLPRHLGAGWGLVGLLRAVPFHASRHRLFLPADLLDQARLDPHAVFDRKAGAALVPVIRTIAELAASHLALARACGRSMPARLRNPLLLAGLARLFLADLERAGWDPFVPARPRPLAILRLLATKWLGRS